MQPSSPDMNTHTHTHTHTHTQTQLSVDVCGLGLGLRSALERRRKMGKTLGERKRGERESLILHFLHVVSGRQLTFSADALGWVTTAK